MVEVSGLKIGLLHGHQIIPWGDEEALANKAISMGVDVLVTMEQANFQSRYLYHFIFW